MIDFKICRACEFGEWNPPEEDEDGNMTIIPTVLCHLRYEILTMNSMPPNKCPDKLRHKMFTQDIPNNFANHMSGGRRHET